MMQRVRGTYIKGVYFKCLMLSVHNFFDRLGHDVEPCLIRTYNHFTKLFSIQTARYIFFRKQFRLESAEVESPMLAFRNKV